MFQHVYTIFYSYQQYFAYLVVLSIGRFFFHFEWFVVVSYCDWELLGSLSGKEYICQCRICGFNLWSGKTPCRRKWQPTPVFLPGKTPWTEALGRLQSTGSQRVRQELTPEQQQKLVVLICVSHCMMVLNVFTCYLLTISSLMRCLFTYFCPL